MKLLPKIYENEGNKYPQHLGKPKLSYSAYTSFKEDGYRGEFFGNYFLGIKGEGNIFTSYGSLCGKYFEELTNNGLSDFDCSVINKVDRPENAKYEVEVVIDRGWYVIQGYIDREYMTKEGLTVEDLKTGAISSKKAFYSSDLYQQTTLYSYQREVEGETISKSGVILLDRKGNGQDKYPLRLTGEIEYIPTPYSKDRAEAFLLEFDKTAEEIRRYYAVYQKYLKD